MIPITFKSDPLPSNFRGTLEDFRQRFLINLRGTIQDAHVLSGRVGGSQPTQDIGPWLTNGTWFVWNGATYVPATLKVGNRDSTITLAPPVGTVTNIGLGSVIYAAGNKVQVLQDREGTVALLSDIYAGRPVVVLTGTTPTIDWNQGHNFSHILSANATYSFANTQDGQEIAVLAKNTGTSWTVTWPNTIFWAGGTPSQTALKTDMYILRNIGGSIIGRQVAGY